LNGVRLILVDFWGKGPKYQRVMLWAILLVWLVVMVPGIYFMTKHTFETMFGSGS